MPRADIASLREATTKSPGNAARLHNPVSNARVDLTLAKHATKLSPMSPPWLSPVLSRRWFIRGSLLGAAGVAFGSLLLAADRSQTVTTGLRVLSQHEADVLAALAERLCPAGSDGAPGAAALHSVEQIDAALAAAPDDAQQGFKLALRVFDNAFIGALCGERLQPFRTLSGSKKDDAIRAWQHARLGVRRTLMRGLETTILSVYWGDAQTWPRIGYPGPPEPLQLRAHHKQNLHDLSDLRATNPAKNR